LNESPLILGIESSCDDTSVAIIKGHQILANVVSNQKIHAEYGGVVPELASRAHQQNIVPAYEIAIKRAGIQQDQLNAIAYTRGPGLMGSLLVGSSFAKGLSLALEVPLIEVHHMHAHILAHLIDDNEASPEFPFICLTVSGGHTQLIIVKSPTEMQIVGETIDDAAGEAFDKAAKMMGLPYPGGPLIDKLAKEGKVGTHPFKVGMMKGYDFSFSGFKTSVLYYLRDQVEKDPHFIEKHQANLCASIQDSILSALFKKLDKLVAETGIKEVAIAGGVSANSELRKRLAAKSNQGWNTYLPKFEYCTDNAAMIAMAGYFRYQAAQFGELAAAPQARMPF
jgi:N6-L-threonylcarbamoyladenine synthase